MPFASFKLLIYPSLILPACFLSRTPCLLSFTIHALFLSLHLNNNNIIYPSYLIQYLKTPTMAIFPLPPGLLTRINLPPTYQSATTTTPPPPPAYITPPVEPRLPSTPGSTPLPLSASASPLPSSSTAQIPPPEYSPSVYPQHQRLSHYLPPASNLAELAPGSAVGSGVKGGRVEQLLLQEQEYHGRQFLESGRDLEAGVPITHGDAAEAEAESAGVKEEEGTKGSRKGVFRLCPPVTKGEVERLYWKRGIVAMGLNEIQI